MRTNQTSKMTSKQPTLKLYYFDFRGKGEAIRLYCAYSGLELEDYQFKTRAEMHELRDTGHLAFGQVPMLEVDGTHELVQAAAILRYLSKLTGDFPKDPLVAAKIDALLDYDTDTFTGANLINHVVRYGIDLPDENRDKCYDSVCTKVLPGHLRNFEKMLEASPTDWLAGTEKPTIADFVWFCRLRWWIPDKPELTDELKALTDFPVCRAFVERFQSLDAIKAYYDAKK